MHEELSPEYHKQRKKEGLRGVTAALSAVTSRLGFKYRILYQAADSSRIGVMFARAYDENAVKRMATYSGEPMLALNWGKDDEVMLVESQGCEEGVTSIRVEFIVQDPALDPELVDKLFYEVNFTQEACLTARWTIEYLEKIVDLYIREFARVIEPFGWQIYGGYWLHAEMQQSSDWSTWEVYARAPRDSRLKDICLYIHPFSNLITIQPPHHYEQQDNPARRQVIDAIIKARIDLKRELEERPLWMRADSKKIASSPMSEIVMGDNASAIAPDSKKKEDYPKIESLRKYYPDASEERAKEILDAMPAAYKSCKVGKGRWSAGFIRKYTSLKSPNTVTKYLKALWMIGIKEWKGAPNPYRPHNSRDASVPSD